MNKKKLTVGGMVGVLAIGVVGVGISNASSLGYQTEIGLGFTFNPSITVSVSGDLSINELTPGNYADSNIVTIGVVTNAVNGYVLQATTGTNSTNNRLVNTENSNYYFTSLGTNETVTSMNNANDNTWGYSYSTDNGTTWISSPGTLGYSGLPQDANTTAAECGSGGKTLIDTNDSASNQSVKFKIGAKAASNQASGEYTNTVNFYAVTYPEPVPAAEAKCTTPIPNVNIIYMQDITSSNKTTVLGNMTANAQYALKDNRDDKTYCVAKLADGNIWMTQNLDLEIGGANTATLTSENTDLTTSTDSTGIYNTDYSTSGTTITWQPTLANTNATVTGTPAEITNFASGSPSNSVTGWTNDDNVPYMAEGGDRYVYTSGVADTSTLDTIYSSLDECTTTGGHSKEECAHYHVGNYYNWTAAIASSASNSIGSTRYDIAANSICPKGWRLPKGRASSDTATTREFGELWRAAGITGSLTTTSYAANGFLNIRQAPLFFARGGHVNGTVFYNGASSGYWWSSSVYSTSYAYNANFNGTNINSASIYSYDRYYGRSVRCIVR